MVDIFTSNGPYLSFEVLMRGSIQEMGSFLLHFVLLCGILTLAKRFRTKPAVVGAAVLMPVLQILYLWNVSIRSEVFLSFAFALLLTAQLWILRLLPLQSEDYLFFFSALLFPVRLFNSTSAMLGHLWLLWIVFCVCYATAGLGLHKLRGNQFSCYFLYVMLSLSAYTFYVTVLFLVPYLSERMGSYLAGVICTVAVLFLLFISLTLLVRVKLQQHLMRLNRFGGKNQRMERYFSGLSVLILTFCTLAFLPFTILTSQNSLVLLLFPILCFIFLWGQMPFVLLLYRVAFYKDHATFSQWEKEGLASYYRDLTGSLSAIQEIRHDIKNIFFTMGSYVDRSGDQEMKAFFWEKLYPYSLNAIRQSELLSTLYQIPNESLRAFLHLKCSQIQTQKVPVRLEVHMVPEQYQVGMDVIDLTRILGILLDNAMEEARQVTEGDVEIKIAANTAGCSYFIRNPVTAQTIGRGIRPGTTSKGNGHGQGLLIVRQLLDQYDYVTLSSILREGQYTQSLSVFYGSWTGRTDGAAAPATDPCGSASR